jgi:hypothetical protein
MRRPLDDGVLGRGAWGPGSKRNCLGSRVRDLRCPESKFRQARALGSSSWRSAPRSLEPVHEPSQWIPRAPRSQMLRWPRPPRKSPG